ncbi:TPA: type VI secretion system accessory protein TagJ [Enterobacter asburiae]
MHSLQQLVAGQSLNEALAQVEGQIKRQPADADLRASFVQLMCLVGNWSRALTQLKSWRALKPQAQPAVNLLEQAIGGELKRALVFRGLATPRMPGDDDRYRLGSLTEWRPLSGNEQQLSGHGQKSWLSAQDDFPLLNLETLTFATAESAS